MTKKRKTLRQEMNEALLSHGHAHFIALKWFEKQDRLKRAKRTLAEVLEAWNTRGNPFA